jgi:hypothetical protein
MWKYFEMKMLGKNTSWVRFAKRGKKQGINGGKQRREGWFCGGMKTKGGRNSAPKSHVKRGEDSG